MKNIFIKLLCILAFILCFSGNAFSAGNFNINSITYDNSSTMLSINSFDNEEFSFAQKPKLNIIQEENKAYFDITSGVLKCPPQDIVVSSQDIKEIIVKQISDNPNTVRVQITYNEGFNPKNIQLKILNNTIFVRIKTTVVQNYYFQQIYSDFVQNVNKLYEPIVIQTPFLATDNSVVSQINSAFKLGATTEDKNYILTKKDLVLPTKYYVDNVDIKNGTVIVTGIGAITLTKPFTLTNPARIVYDVPNALVNPVIRNKEIHINQNDSIKIGQFDKDTVRIVITTTNIMQYSPIIYSDLQKLVFADYSYKPSVANANVTALTDEIIDNKTHSIKISFSKPVIYGIEREKNKLDIILYNIERYQDINLKSSTIFEGAKFTQLKDNTVRFSIPADKDDIVDIHCGTDSKTLRIKIKSNKIDLPKPAIQQPINVQEVINPPKKQTTTKKIIVVDPGHGGSDCGATRNNIFEKDITLDISKKVVTLLEKKGYEVYMTRTTDETVSLQDRVDISENIMPDVFVSIHVNSSNSEAPKGIETHYYKDNSLMLAKTVHASLLNHVNANDRGLFKSKFYVINHTTSPAILVEIGFISNNSERAQLVTESRKQATAKAIAEGINDYFR